ncbi:hypothetical protein R1sor_005839 [Riccia sorocarpa]|uniref:tRNA(Ile)-lysidine synthetase n=1 Tax=Riccia sorocarpa TaxID=122646 RepID=A0ABD3HLC3_9MARC
MISSAEGTYLAALQAVEWYGHNRAASLHDNSWKRSEEGEDKDLRRLNKRGKKLNPSDDSVDRKEMDGRQFNWDDVDARFAEQMRLARLTPSHDIGIAVSGGADSIALCLLMTRWKRQLMLGGRQRCGRSVGFVVDHNLREESAEEAVLVKEWVCNLGIHCEILKCQWPRGKPSGGHIQEAARYARYALLSQACRKSGVEALLTAHHADDQAELFILRLSRRSDIAGLAGMAFASELPPALSDNCRPLLVLIRPLLRFTKRELYAVCQESSQAWVEDPTNTNLAFTRNRIRKELQDQQYSVPLRKELPKLMEYCRQMRSIIDRDRDILLHDVAQISQEFGTVTIDLQKLASRGLTDLVTHRALASILQFVGQRERSPRGRAVEMLLERLRSGTLQGACTVGGCYIFPSPGTKGSKAIVCFSPDSPPTSGQLEAYTQQLDTASLSQSCGPKRVDNLPLGDPIIVAGDSGFSASGTFSTKRPPRSIEDFKSLGLLSEEGASLLQKLTSDNSIDTAGSASVNQLTGTRKLTSITDRMMQRIAVGETQYFMNRYCVSLIQKPAEFSTANSSGDSFCGFQQGPFLIRHFKDHDWDYLFQLVEDRLHTPTQGCAWTCRVVQDSNTEERRCNNIEGRHTGRQANPFMDFFPRQVYQKMSHALGSCKEPLNRAHSKAIETAARCDSERMLTAKKALAVLRGIPKPVRRSQPVLATYDGLLLSLPCAGFYHCKFLSLTAKFRPRAAFGGGKAVWH